MKIYRLLLLMLLGIPSFAQTHVFPATDTQNRFTGLNSFDQINYEVNTGGAGALGTAQICTTCWGNTPSLSIRRQDNSAPVGNVDIGTNFLDPIVEIRAIPSAVGSFVGSQTPLALVIANVNNKDYITLTQSVTSSGSPQTVSVSDSSVFSIVADINGFTNNQMNIDFGKGTTETVTITAIPDSTHVTAIFSQNHANGANAHGAFNTGFHLGQMVVVGENAGNQTDLLGQNVNLTCQSASPHACNLYEGDITVYHSLGRAAAYSGEDAIHPLIWGAYIAMTNIGGGTAGGVTDVFMAYSLDGVTTANNGYMCAGCAKNFGFVVTANNGATTTAAVGFSVQRATTAGFQCGSDQTAAENPSWTTSDPTDCFLILSQTNGSFTQSNFLTYNSYASSVKHTFSEVLHWNAGGLFYLVDTHSIDTNNYIMVGEDSYFNTSNAGGHASGYRLRSSNLIVAAFDNTAGAAILSPRNSGTLEVDANTVKLATNLLMSSTAPSIAAAGCGGSAASIPNNNGTAAFTVNVGTTPTTACTVTLPTAATGWNCFATDITTNSTTVFLQKQSGGSTTTAIITNYNDVAAAANFVASDVVRMSCFAY